MTNYLDTKEYHVSTSNELIAIKDRVRNLISHWGEDGRHKESVLKSIITRFLPHTFNATSGFIVNQTGIRGKHAASRQIDILIYDLNYPVLFREGDFAIVTPDSVRGIIEVKANVRNQGLKKVMIKANKNGEFIYKYKSNKEVKFFNGIFSYEGFERKNIDKIREEIERADEDFKTKLDYSRFKVNHISFNRNLLYKYWDDREDKNYLYDINNLSFSFFISNLMSSLCEGPVRENMQLWFPTDKSKEVIAHF